MDLMHKNGVINAHHISGSTPGALDTHTILQDVQSFQRSTIDKQDKYKALLSIHLKELLNKRQTSLTLGREVFPIQCKRVSSEGTFLESRFLEF